MEDVFICLQYPKPGIEITAFLQKLTLSTASVPALETANLTAREVEVLHLVAEGLTDPKIVY